MSSAGKLKFFFHFDLVNEKSSWCFFGCTRRVLKKKFPFSVGSSEFFSSQLNFIAFVIREDGNCARCSRIWCECGILRSSHKILSEWNGATKWIWSLWAPIKASHTFFNHFMPIDWDSKSVRSLRAFPFAYFIRRSYCATINTADTVGASGTVWECTRLWLWLETRCPYFSCW